MLPAHYYDYAPDLLGLACEAMSMLAARASTIHVMMFQTLGSVKPIESFDESLVALRHGISVDTVVVPRVCLRCAVVVVVIVPLTGLRCAALLRFGCK